MSCYLIHMFADWPVGIHTITHMLHSGQLPGIDPKIQLWIMMEILCAIPDEAMSISTALQRPTLRTDLAGQATYVLNVMEHYLAEKCAKPSLDQYEQETLQVVAKCASAWLRHYAFPLDTCTGMATSMVHLVKKCYWNCQMPDNGGCMSAEENELTEWCLETLTSMLVQPDAHRYSDNAMTLLQLFLDELAPIAVAENCEDNQNEDIVAAIYTLFVTSIETHSRALIAGCIADSAAHLAVLDRLVGQVIAFGE